MNTNLKISLRSIKRNKVHSLISIIGLGIGLGSILLLSMLYIHNKSFDQFMPDHKNVYRVLLGNSAQTAYPLGETLKAENPAVSDFFRYFQKKDFDIKDSQNQIFQDNDFGFADPGLFNIWGVKMISGVAAQTRTEIAISKTIEQKYFKGESALGKQLNIRLNEDFLLLTVSGIYNDFPSNSTLAPKFIAPIELCSEALGFNQKMFGTYNTDLDEFKNWNKTNFYTYIHLTPSSQPKDVADFMQKYTTLTDNDKLKDKAYDLQPASRVYLATSVEGSFFSRLGNAKDLQYYLAIASLILLIAIINYIFLNKAKIESRLKEFGSQKALGASKLLLHWQIILESNIVAFLSLIPAALVILTGMPFINKTLNQTLGMHVLSYWETWCALLGIVLLTGTLSGIFIAYGTVKVPSILLLKGKKTAVPKRGVWNNAILSVHFIIFIVLISGVLTLNKQIKFALTDFIGIDPKNIMVFELNSNNLSKQFSAIKNEVDKLPGVVASAGSSFVPPFNNILPIHLQDAEGNKIRFDGLIMGQGMIELLGIQVMDGESFGEYKAGGPPQIIYNESAARKYNLKTGELFSNLNVRAIVKDFNAHSMRELIQPLVIIQQHPEKMRMLVVKTNGVNNAALSGSIQKILKEIAPDKVVNSYLLTEQINQFYSSEKSQAKLVNAFALLAIFLSVIGLLGMTYNAMLQRKKEIGIRKVNGAKISEVLILLNCDFVKWVLVAFVVATPLAWYAMHKWLENFAYKTDLSWWIFALAGLMALGIALLTVSFQSYKAAVKNPVESLRYE